MDGHPDLITPWNSTEFHALAASLSRHHNTMNDHVRQVAAELNKELPKATGARFQPLRLDLKMNARRVTRHLVHAGALNLAAGRAYTQAYMTFLDLFTTSSSATHGRTFDVNK